MVTLGPSAPTSEPAKAIESKHRPTSTDSCLPFDEIKGATGHEFHIDAAPLA